MKKGYIPHNKGKTKENYEPLKRVSIKMSNTRKRLFKEGKLKSHNKGKKLPERSGENHHNWKGGLPKCLDCEKQISYGRKRCVACHNQIYIAEKHPFWKGGITSENETIRKSSLYQIWRHACYLRDDFTCKDCNQRGGKLHVHHIKPFSTYPELRFNLNNGVTLCKRCHLNRHKKNYLEVTS